MGTEDLQRRLEESIHAFGPNDPRTLVARTKLADAYYQDRNYIQAFTLKEEVLADLTRQLGADDPITVSVLTGLAHIWFAGWMADRLPERAVPLFEFAVAERMRVSGPNDPDTLSARNDLPCHPGRGPRASRSPARRPGAYADLSSTGRRADPTNTATKSDIPRWIRNAGSPIRARYLKRRPRWEMPRGTSGYGRLGSVLD